MKYSIIGTGFIFRKHFQAIKETGGEIVDVVNETHGRGEEWKKAVRNPGADCVVILAPNYLHYPIAMAAADAGKIVLSEKPLAIKSEHARELAGRKNIFAVQQLHYHPSVKKMKQEVDPGKHYGIDIDISVYRDQHYFNGWKGDMEKSGGPLFTLGAHYFELLLSIFGPAVEMSTGYLDEKTGEGTVKGKNYDCKWRISVGAKIDEPWKRVFTINGEPFNLSSKENLAEENLHGFVYRDLLEGKGITPAEVIPSIELIEKLYACHNQQNR